MGGSSNSAGSSSFSQGVGVCVKDGYSFDGQVSASKDPSNNPGWSNSALGSLVGNGAPDPSGYNAMGDYGGGGSPSNNGRDTSGGR